MGMLWIVSTGQMHPQLMAIKKWPFVMLNQEMDVGVKVWNNPIWVTGKLVLDLFSGGDSLTCSSVLLQNFDSGDKRMGMPKEEHQLALLGHRTFTGNRILLWFSCKRNLRSQTTGNSTMIFCSICSKQEHRTFLEAMHAKFRILWTLHGNIDLRTHHFV